MYFYVHELLEYDTLLLHYYSIVVQDLNLYRLSLPVYISKHLKLSGIPYVRALVDEVCLKIYLGRQDRMS